jgi:hypothetical protein
VLPVTGTQFHNLPGDLQMFHGSISNKLSHSIKLLSYELKHGLVVILSLQSYANIALLFG